MLISTRKEKIGEQYKTGYDNMAAMTISLLTLSVTSFRALHEVIYIYCAQKL